MRKEDFIFSTTSHLEGYTIYKYLGLITEQVVLGIDLVSEIFAGFTDVFGGRSATLENHIQELQKQALNNAKRKAIQKGANSIVGLRLDVDEISGKNVMMLMATVSGTAVLAKKDSMSQDSIANNDIGVVDMEEVKREVLIGEYCEKLTGAKTYINDTIKIIKELMYLELLIPIDFLIDLILNSFTQLSKGNTIITDYLNKFEQSEINEELNRYLSKYSGGNDIFDEIYETFAIVDYNFFCNHN